MILLYNVYLDLKTIKNQSNISVFGNNTYFRGLYENYSNIEIFKYALASVVDIYPWSKVIINFGLHPDLESRKIELINYINDLFIGHNLLLNDTRCERQNDWIKLYDSIDDDIIFFCCNHDHVFVDSETKYFINTIEEFKENFSDDYASLYFSHWQEVLSLCFKKNPKNSYFSNGDCTLLNNFAYTQATSVDSIQIITKKVYQKWWFTGDFNEMFFPRTDHQEFIPTMFLKKQGVPYREYFKHFDGYTHITHNKSHMANIVPPLFIPPNFFNNDIKIKLGYDEYYRDCVNINLSKKNYSVIDNHGTDLKCFVDDIPFFWKKKLSVDKEIGYNEKDYLHIRNNTIIDQLQSEFFHGGITNKNVLEKIKTFYNI